MNLQLPDKMSALLRVAIKDAQACEKDPRFKLDMSMWVLPMRDNCYVCLAGAVMICSLGANPSHLNMPGTFAEGKKLVAIDELRIGEIMMAAFNMGILQTVEILALSVKWTEIYDSCSVRGKLSWQQYEQMARDLEAIGE